MASRKLFQSKGWFPGFDLGVAVAGSGAGAGVASRAGSGMDFWGSLEAVLFSEGFSGGFGAFLLEVGWGGASGFEAGSGAFGAITGAAGLTTVGFARVVVIGVLIATLAGF